nr:skin secretory protein xP2-like [Equus caballus]
MRGQEGSRVALGVCPCPPLEGGPAAPSSSPPQSAGRARPWPRRAGLLQPHHPSLRGQWGNGGQERQGLAGPLSWAEAPGQEIEAPPICIAASVFPFTGLFIHSFTHGLTHSLIHPVIHSFRPSLIHHPFIRSAPARAVEPAEDRAQELGEPSPAPAPAMAVEPAEHVAPEQGEPCPAPAPARAQEQAEVAAREEGKPSTAPDSACAWKTAEAPATVQREPSTSLPPAGAGEAAETTAADHG